MRQNRKLFPVRIGDQVGQSNSKTKNRRSQRGSASAGTRVGSKTNGALTKMPARPESLGFTANGRFQKLKEATSEEVLAVEIWTLKNSNITLRKSLANSNKLLAEAHAAVARLRHDIVFMEASIQAGLNDKILDKFNIANGSSLCDPEPDGSRWWVKPPANEKSSPRGDIAGGLEVLQKPPKELDSSTAPTEQETSSGEPVGAPANEAGAEAESEEVVSAQAE